MKTQIAIITTVPDLVNTVLQESILRQGEDRDAVKFHTVDLREFGEGNYRQVDDTPYGGGSGMVLMPGPMFRAIDHSFELLGSKDDTAVVYPTPQGTQWNDAHAQKLCGFKSIIFICGHYKGIDERVVEKYVTHEYSIGDFVVSAGEIPGLLMIDSMVRLIPGVLNSYDSALSDSFTSPLLDAPWFTKPREIEGMEVPETLLSGHHEKIDAWRKVQRESRTQERRPDLWEQYQEKNKTLEK